MKVKTKGYRGNIVKGATVESNDPKLPKSFLKISAQVKPLILCKPSPYVSLTKPYEEERAKVLALWSPLHPEFEITGVKSLVPGVSARILKSWKEKGRTHYNLQVVFGKEMKIGPFRGVVNVMTNLKKLPIFTIRVSGVVEGPIRILPRRASMFSDPAIMGGMAAAGFSLYSEKEGLKVLRAVTNLQGLVIRLIPVQEGRKYYVITVWPGGTLPQNPYNGTVEVYTNSDIQSIIRIPVTIYGRKVEKKRKIPIPSMQKKK